MAFTIELDGKGLFPPDERGVNRFWFDTVTNVPSPVAMPFLR